MVVKEKLKFSEIPQVGEVIACARNLQWMENTKVWRRVICFDLANL